MSSELDIYACLVPKFCQVALELGSLRVWEHLRSSSVSLLEGNLVPEFWEEVAVAELMFHKDVNLEALFSVLLIENSKRQTRGSAYKNSLWSRKLSTRRSRLLRDFSDRSRALRMDLNAQPRCSSI